MMPAGPDTVFRHSAPYRLHWNDMESIFDLLSNRIPDEPPEIKIVKQYVRDNFRENAVVTARDKDIVVTVRSGSLAASLRMRTSEIKRQLGKSDKRLIFRIGQVGQ